MPSLIKPPFPDIITALPVMDHSIEVEAAKPKKSWKVKFHAAGQGNVWNAIFGSHQSIRISRGRLMSHVFPTPEQKCGEILLWGYPNNERAVVAKLLPKLSAIAKLAQARTPWPQYFLDLHRIGGLNISTITKLAYYHQRTFDNLSALILDQTVISALQSWPQVCVPGLLRHYNGRARYIDYLRTMNNAAAQLAIAAGQPCTTDQLEFFLFAMGKSF